jgi:predicted Zn-dependent protease
MPVEDVKAAVQRRREGVDVGGTSLITFGKNEQREAMEERAQEAYRLILSEATVLDSSHAQVVRVRAIMHKLLPAASKFNPRSSEWNWEANVIVSKDINAFCCAGGKIAFYTGLLDSLQMSDDEVAAVMGHEMAHALREHRLEQMCKGDVVHGLARLGGHVLQEDGANATLVRVAGGAAEWLISKKFSRVDECDADLVGMELAARAGFHPRGAVTLQEKLAKHGTSSLTWLSTHPSGDRRIAELEANLPEVLPLYEHAVAEKTTSEKDADAVVNEVGQQVDRTVEALEDAIAHGAGSAGALLQKLVFGAPRK